MLASWQVSSENVEGEGVAGDLYELYARYQAEREDGRDLLNEMAERFDAQIAEAKKVLATLQADPP